MSQRELTRYSVQSLDFSPDSLGAPIGEYLDGRERPAGLLETRLENGSSVGLYLGDGMIGRLGAAGVATIDDLLRRRSSDLPHIPHIAEKRTKQIVCIVAQFREALEVIPETNFLRAVFGREPRPLLAEDEESLRGDVRETLSSLSVIDERGAAVLNARFGFENGRRTLESVAEDHGVTRERVKQIEAKTLRKVRHPVISQHLQQYLSSLA